jgi:TfoX/Sxy family transcriptional regulator of competence genes
MPYDEKLAERIRKLVAGRRDVSERKMMGGLMFKTASGMFCAASGRGGLLVRVDAALRDKFLGEDHVEPADIGGRRMSGFVRVQSEGYRTESSLKKWVERGLEAVGNRPAPSRAAAAKRKTAKPKAARRSK